MRGIVIRVAPLWHYLWWLGFMTALAVFSYSVYHLYTNDANAEKQFIACLLFGSFGMTCVMLAERLLHKRFAGIVFAVLGPVIAAGSVYLLNCHSMQDELYNRALVMLDNGEDAEAVKLFDQSIEAYKMEASRNKLVKLFLPPPREVLVARAHFHKASCFDRLQKSKEAVASLQQSLHLNPGNCYTSDLSLAHIAVKYVDAMDTKSNLEKHYKKGQGGGGHAKPGPGKQADGKEPGQQKQDGRDRPAQGAGNRSREML